MKTRLKQLLLTCLLSLGFIFAGFSTLLTPAPVYALPEDPSPDTIHDNNPDRSDQTPGNEAVDSETSDSTDSDPNPTDETPTTDITDDSENSDDPQKAENHGEDQTTNSNPEVNICQTEFGSVSWILCPVMQIVGGGVDYILSKTSLTSNPPSSIKIPPSTKSGKKPATSLTLSLSSSFSL